MLAMAWGLVFGTVITLVLVPSIFCLAKELKQMIKAIREKRSW
jgi:hypothetical protein